MGINGLYQTGTLSSKLFLNLTPVCHPQFWIHLCLGQECVHENFVDPA